MRTHEQACVCIIKPVCASFYLNNTKNTKNRTELQNSNSNNLTCFYNIQLHKPKLDKHVKEYYNKKTKQTERLKHKKRKEKKKKSLD